MYQHLIHTHKTSVLSGEQIREGWLKHMKQEEENYLWVSNQQAFDLMKKGMIPPETGSPEHNPHYDMIDAQLTTEIFGLFAPTRPDIGLKMAKLPIQTVARENAEKISQFYVVMHALASTSQHDPIKLRLQIMAEEAKRVFPKDSYMAYMYEFVKENYSAGIP